jgi:cytoskeletal protein RodZ
MRVERFCHGFGLALRCAALLAAGVLWAAAGFAQTDNPNSASSPDQSETKAQKDQNSSEPRTTKLRIRVTTKDDKPVANASVYVRFYESGGFLRRDKLAELDLKTNQDGSVKVPEIPQGKILIQVIAKGWHTFGKWFDVQKDEETIAIKLEPPPRWY